MSDRLALEGGVRVLERVEALVGGDVSHLVLGRAELVHVLLVDHGRTGVGSGCRAVRGLELAPGPSEAFAAGRRLRGSARRP